MSHYDNGISGEKFPVGDQVWLYVPMVKKEGPISYHHFGRDHTRLLIDSMQQPIIKFMQLVGSIRRYW